MNPIPTKTSLLRHRWLLLVLCIVQACSPALLTSSMGMRTEALPMPKGSVEGGATGFASRYFGVPGAPDWGGGGAGALRFPLGRATSMHVSIGGGFPDTFSAKATLIATWPKYAEPRVHGGINASFGGVVSNLLQVQDVALLEGTQGGIFQLEAGGHLHVRFANTFRWTSGFRLMAGLLHDLSITAHTGPAFRFPTARKLEPFLLVEGTLTGCVAGNCAGVAPGVAVTFGWTSTQKAAETLPRGHVPKDRANPALEGSLTAR